MILRLAAEARRERNQVANRRALNFRAEENHHVLFGFERGFQLHQRFGGGRDRTVPSLCASQRTAARSPPFAVFTSVLGLAMDFASTAIDHVERASVMAHAGANLPGDQRILLRHVVADQQNCAARCKRRPWWPGQSVAFGPRAAARPA